MTVSPVHMSAHILRNERECQDCGLFQCLPELAPGEVAACSRCNATLRHGRRDSMNRTLACAVAAMLLFVVALQLPFLDVRAVGRSYQANLFTGPSPCWNSAACGKSAWWC